MNHSDMLLQYEDVKRKLQESYMITFQLLRDENKRLRQNIQEKKEFIAHLKKSPTFKLHLIPTTPSFCAYTIKSSFMYFSNAIYDETLNGFKWGEYTLSAPDYSFELAAPTDGITIEKKDDHYLLIITEEVTESITIDILMNFID